MIQVVHFARCWSCKSYGLCAADCIDAPWNQDRPATHRIGYLLRQRRWAGFPVPFDAVFFRRDRHAHARIHTPNRITRRFS